MKSLIPTARSLLPLLAASAFTFSTAQAALVVPAGNPLVVNDTDLNVAWTQDANLFKTMLGDPIIRIW